MDVRVPKEHSFRERECVHRRHGVDGDFYKGTIYIDHLKRLQASAAMRMAMKVTSFFWADAAQIAVWLCRDCATELRLRRH